MNDLLKRGMQTDVTALLVSVIRQQVKLFFIGKLHVYESSYHILFSRTEKLYVDA